MNNEWKERWVQALRSGEYKQGRRRLRNGDQFCCLGVLCDLIAKDNIFGGWAESSSGYSHFLGESMVLPQQVLELVGLPTMGDYVFDVRVNKYVFNGDERITLTGLNDHGADFEFIAKAIEESL